MRWLKKILGIQKMCHMYTIEYDLLTKIDKLMALVVTDGAEKELC